MNKVDRLKQYIALMGVTYENILDNGYPHSKAYLSQLLNENRTMSDDEEKLIYNAIAVARMNKRSKNEFTE